MVYTSKPKQYKKPEDLHEDSAIHNFFDRIGDALLHPHYGHGERCFNVSTRGEHELLTILESGLDPKSYYIFNNIILPTSEGVTTEVDHLVVSDQGIFVIENKDMKGLILGHKYEATWTQSFGHENNNVFPNPLRQNWGHTEALKSLFPKLGDENFHPIVAFSKKDTDNKFPKGKPEGVLYYNEVIPFIKNKPHLEANTTKILYVIGKLSTICQAPPATREEHIERVKKIKREFKK